jgi:hypothetical protein
MESTVSFKKAEFEAAQAMVGVRRYALEWAVAFSQTPLDELSPDEIVARTNQLAAFVTYAAKLGVSYEAQGVGDIPMEVTLSGAQDVMRAIFRPLAEEGRVTLPVGRTLALAPDGRSYTDVAREYAINAENIQAGVDYLLGQLPEWGRTLTACPALYLKPRRRCRKWFLAKPTQRVCSAACRHREYIREFRRRRTPA